MVLVLVVGGGLGWFIHRASVQRHAVKAIMAAGGKVNYDFQQYTRPINGKGKPSAPQWLVDLLGIDYFVNVTSVTFETQQTEAILAHVGRLHRLEGLNASLTPVTDAGLAHLGGLSELRALACLGTPGLTDAGLTHLARLERLEALSIDGPTRIEGPGLAHLASLPRLRLLSIHIKTDVGLLELSQLTGLRKLFISTAKVTDATLAQLSRLTWLEELAFGGETGSDAGLAHLKALTNLKMLQLHGPWFTDAGLAPLSEMDHLSTFFVADTTSVTADGLNNLQQQRPALRIGVNGSGQVPKARLDNLRSAVGPDAIPTRPR
jgi:hypothetical protein